MVKGSSDFELQQPNHDVKSDHWGRFPLIRVGVLKKMVTIYFAGSIRGGRQDAERYRKMILYLRTHGDVLTEHVGNDELLLEEKTLSEEEIFSRDMQWLHRAELVIAEVSVPSLGVGYELAAAERLGKKILCLCRKSVGDKLSAMIKGNPAFTLRRYECFEEAQKWMDSFINENSS